jgi:hypothetical protein
MGEAHAVVELQSRPKADDALHTSSPSSRVVVADVDPSVQEALEVEVTKRQRRDMA